MAFGFHCVLNVVILIMLSAHPGIDVKYYNEILAKDEDYIDLYNYVF